MKTMYEVRNIPAARLDNSILSVAQIQQKTEYA